MLLLAVLLLSASVLLAGAAVRLLPGAPTRWLRPLLAFSGAYLFSLTILHLLPETLRLADARAAHVGYWVLAGFFLQLLLEYLSAGVEHGHLHPAGTASADGHHHHHGPRPALLLAALVAHSMLEGSILTERATQSGGFWPVVLGVALHHVPAALALMSVLLDYHQSFRRALANLALFAAGSPLGMLLGSAVQHTSVYPVLAGLVAGNFLHISTTILFETSPEHRFNYAKLLATAAGVGLALLLGG